MNELQLAAFILLWVVLVVEGALIFMLYRHVGQVYAPKVAGLPVGSAVPGFTAMTRSGQRVSMKQLLDVAPTLLVFGTFECAPCQMLLSNSNVRRFLGTTMHSWFVTPSTPGWIEASTEYAGQSELTIVGVEPDVFDDYQIRATPFAYAVNADGKVVASGPVARPEALLEVCSQALDRARADDGRVRVSSV